MNKPNFFLIGAPRSGTTSMYHYLKAHPDIFMPSLKEPNFFCTDLSTPTLSHKKFRQKKNYFQLFSDVKDENLIGDATVHYLYSKKAAQNIKKFNSDAKIIIMLRSPIEVIYSLYYLNYYSGQENCKSVNDALKAENDRKKGLNLPKNLVYFRENFYYLDTVKYANQVKRYLDNFDKKNIHIIIFKDFKNNPKKVFKQTLNFLNVDADFIPDLKVHNENKVPKSHLLQKIMNNFIVYPLQQTNLINLIPVSVVESVKKLTRKQKQKTKYDPKLKREIKKKLKKDIAELQKLLNRDLSFWY